MPTEKYYRKKVHECLHKTVYQQGMDGTATSGTFDNYYEHSVYLTMGWIEWKRVLAKNPQKWDLLTPLQASWGQRAEYHGRNCAVLVGGPSGIYIFDSIIAYENGRVSTPMKYREAANWIAHTFLKPPGYYQ